MRRQVLLFGSYRWRIGKSIESDSTLCLGKSKFRKLAPVLTSKGGFLKVNGRVYRACMQSILGYGSETWAMNVYVWCKEACLALCYMKLKLVALRHVPCSHGVTCHPHVLYPQGQSHTGNLHPQSSTAVTLFFLIADRRRKASNRPRSAQIAQPHHVETAYDSLLTTIAWKTARSAMRCMSCCRRVHKAKSAGCQVSYIILYLRLIL